VATLALVADDVVTVADEAIVADAIEARATGESASWREADDYLTLTKRGWTQKKIAKECETKQARVSKYVSCAENYSVLNTRPSFWEAFSQVNGEKKSQRKAKRAERKRFTTTGGWELHVGEVLAEGENFVKSASVDWIITDPPYPKEFLPVYSDLGAFAARTLKPNGSLLCMVGQSYLPDVLARLSEHLRYHWTVAYLTPGGQAVQLFDRHVNTFWKPVLWFVNGEYTGDWIGDVTRSDTNDNDKRFHHWGQSESGIADLLERFTLPNEVVCDPFVGGGTTAVVAVEMGRHFIGIDRDPDAIRTTRERLLP
jgi:hypothetical protein